MQDDDAAEPDARSGPDDARALDKERPRRWADDPARATSDALDLATIRQAAARDAINAIALAEVVAALTARSIPIRCPIIPDGTPQQYRWRTAERRFVASSARGGTSTRADTARPVGVPRPQALDPAAPGRLPRPLGAGADPDPVDHPEQPAQLRGPLELRGSGDPGQRGRRIRRLRTAPGRLLPRRCSTRCCPCTWSRWPTTPGTTRTSTAPCSRPGTATRSADSLLLVSHATRDKHRPSAEFAMFLEQARRRTREASASCSRARPRPPRCAASARRSTRSSANQPRSAMSGSSSTTTAGWSSATRSGPEAHSRGQVCHLRGTATTDRGALRPVVSHRPDRPTRAGRATTAGSPAGGRARGWRPGHPRSTRRHRGSGRPGPPGSHGPARPGTRSFQSASRLAVVSDSGLPVARAALSG